MAKKRIKRILTSSERRKKIRRKRLWKLFFFVAILGLLGYGIVYILRLHNLRIVNVNINGLNEVQTSEVRGFIDQDLAGNKFLLIPKSEIILYSTNNLEKNLQEKFSYIKEISIEKKYPDTLNIDMTGRSPIGLYCESKCYFIDSDGYIYSEAPNFSEGVYTVYVDQINVLGNDALGTQFIDKNSFKLIQDYIKDLKNLNLEVGKVTLIAPKEIRFDTRQNNYILLSLDKPYEETLQNIKTVFFQGAETFEYIDARYGNKIYYK